MPGCPFCLDVSPSALQSDLDSHIKAKHNVQSRDDSGFEVKVWKVQDREFEVLEKQPDPESNLRIYRCPSCVTEAHSTACMITHIERKHIVPWNQKIDNKEWTSDEKKLQKVYCDLCWMDFPNAASLNTHQQYDKAHKKRAAYTQGSGCDLCRITGNLDMETHQKHRIHCEKLAYKAGTGCDLCREWIFFHEDIMDLACALNRHNQLNYSTHNDLQKYKPGSGCDICCLKLKPHERTKRHINARWRKELIYKRYITPRITAKSARK
mmetsp:Transcript_20218/g.25641  ORF Transcript_20218/g.25641 Transcript_20218/m.25641 type:complete len:266 (-) Transcript_20218:41-838(-)